MAETEVPQNGNPAIHRMAQLMDTLAENTDGLALDGLTAITGLPRSTVYRIMNSLELTGFVRRTPRGKYLLGNKLLQMGELVAADLHAHELRGALSDWMTSLATTAGETVRLSVFHRGAVILVAGAVPPLSHALTATVHESLPLHAGAASKLFLAHMPEEDREIILSRPLPRLSEFTITDPDLMRKELVRIRRQGWSLDHGEYSARVHSYGVPLIADSGRLLAVASLAFSATEDQAIHQRILDTLLDAQGAALDCLRARNIG